MEENRNKEKEVKNKIDKISFFFLFLSFIGDAKERVGGWENETEKSEQLVQICSDFYSLSLSLLIQSKKLASYKWGS